MSIMEEADALINGTRAKQYGDATDNIGRTAELWSAYLDHGVTTLDVVNMMILLKMSRIITGDGYHRDSYIDICGYAGVAEKIYEYEETA